MNVDITLPDGSVRNYESPVTGYQIAESIGPRLLKDAICVEIDNKFQDLKENNDLVKTGSTIVQK